MDPNMFHLNYILAALQLYYCNSTLSTFLNLSQLNLAKTMQCNSLSAAGAKDNLRPTFGGRRSAADVRRPTSSARRSLFKIFSISSIVSLDLLLYFLSRSSVRCYLHLRWYYFINYNNNNNFRLSWQIICISGNPSHISGNPSQIFSNPESWLEQDNCQMCWSQIANCKCLNLQIVLVFNCKMLAQFQNLGQISEFD